MYKYCLYLRLYYLPLIAGSWHFLARATIGLRGSEAFCGELKAFMCEGTASSLALAFQELAVCSIYKIL